MEEIYRDQIDPLLEKIELTLPMIPRWSDLSNANTPWGKALSKVFLVETKTTAPTASERQILLTDDFLVIQGSKSIKIDLRRKGQTHKALQIIAGAKGSEISKQKIHEQLTGTRYVPHLHDQRIQKLYKRVENEIVSACNLQLWCWPGQRILKLLETIQYE